MSSFSDGPAAPRTLHATNDLVSDLVARGLTLEETHISWVFLGTREVWKVKKPVDLGFLDFTTLEKRRSACDAEIRLNRRLAPDVYLGLVPITRDGAGHLKIGGKIDDDTLIDWAVHMKRLARSDRADQRLSSGRLGDAEVARVAKHIVAFHARTRKDAATARHGSVEAIRINVRENFAQGRRTIERYLNREQATEIEAWQLSFLDANEARFVARQDAGRVRDGHGDLRLEHVYLRGDAIRVIDCIEFNERFRFADVCADIAFLAMDLTWHGRPDLSERFLAAYARAANDFDLYPLVDFYESYRAFVRGKIAALLAESATEAADRTRAHAEARRYYLLALAAERRALTPPRLIAVGGVIASGKSTIAEYLGTALAVPVVDTDRTRKHLLGRTPTTPVHEAAFDGAYAPDVSQAVYAEVLHRANAVLQSGRTVVIDASFSTRQARAATADLARQHQVPFVFVECRTTAEVCRQRLALRAKAPSVSDGREAIFDAFVDRWQKVDELDEGEHLVIDTSQDLDATTAAIDAAFAIGTRSG